MIYDIRTTCQSPPPACACLYNSLPPSSSLTAGAGGGLAASIATCPLDVVKTKLQAQRVAHHDAAYRGVFSKSPPFLPEIFFFSLSNQLLFDTLQSAV